MDTNGAVRTLKQIIATELRIPAERLSDDLTIDALGLDSIGLAELVITVEETFQCELDPRWLTEGFSMRMRLDDFVRALSAAVTAASSGVRHDG